MGIVAAASFLPFDLVKTAGLVGWFYLCLYSVKRTHTSTLIDEVYRPAAGFAALFIGPFLLILLFIVDTVRKLDDGSLSGRHVFFYVLDSLIQKERPLADVLSEDCAVPFKITTFSGIGLSELNRLPAESGEAENANKSHSFIDLTKEIAVGAPESAGKDADSSASLPPSSAEDSPPAPGEVSVQPVESRIQELLRKAIGHHVEHLLIDSVGGGEVLVQAERQGQWVLFFELERAEGVKLIYDLHQLAEMAVGVSTVSHTGAFFVEVGSKKYCLRVVSTPSLDGHKLSVRVMAPVGDGATLSAVGLPDWQGALVRKKALSPSGLILVAAPRGHDKNQLLYSLLRLAELNDKSRYLLQAYADKILPGVSQVEVDWSQGMSFPQSIHEAMLASARIICVDQIPNAETARAVVEAAQNGVMVLAGMYAESWDEALVRLMQWGLGPSHFLTDVKLLVSLRQVRLLCPHCKQRAKLTDFQRSYLDDRNVHQKYVYRADGCEKCGRTGYRGKTALVETVEVKEELIRRYTDPDLSGEVMVREGRDRLFHFLRKTGMRKVLAGETSLEEIKRVSSQLE